MGWAHPQTSFDRGAQAIQRREGQPDVSVEKVTPHSKVNVEVLLDLKMKADITKSQEETGGHLGRLVVKISSKGPKHTVLITHL